MFCPSKSNFDYFAFVKQMFRVFFGQSHPVPWLRFFAAFHALTPSVVKLHNNGIGREYCKKQVLSDGFLRAHAEIGLEKLGNSQDN
jgi:hypothetical protein